MAFKNSNKYADFKSILSFLAFFSDFEIKLHDIKSQLSEFSSILVLYSQIHFIVLIFAPKFSKQRFRSQKHIQVKSKLVDFLKIFKKWRKMAMPPPGLRPLDREEPAGQKRPLEQKVWKL